MDSEESLLSFPCRFPIKVIGHNTEEFDRTVLEVIALHAGEQPLDISRQPSRNSKFISITVTITAESRDQLDKIYQSLTASGQALFAL